MKCVGVAVIVLMSALGCSQTPPLPDHLTQAFEQLVIAMGDSRLSVSERHAIRYMLIEGGSKRLIPILIEHLADGQVFDPKAHGPNSPADPDEGTFVETVGMACERTLYDILLNRHLRNEFRVQDWKAWWKDNKDRTMAEICDLAQAKNGVRAEER